MFEMGGWVESVVRASGRVGVCEGVVIYFGARCGVLWRRRRHLAEQGVQITHAPIPTENRVMADVIKIETPKKGERCAV